MQQRIKKDQPRAFLTDRGDHAVLPGERGDGRRFDHPQRIAGGGGVQKSIVGTGLMGARDKPKRSVKFADIIEKHMQV